MTVDSELRDYHRRLLPFAYNIVGDSQEAEDVVQEVLNHFFMADHSHVHDPVSYLTRSVINRSINARKRIQAQKQNYRGHWLPVPVATDEAVYADIDKARIVSYSLLLLLECLNPRERAVFILKESFDFAHDEIAALLDITPENARQLYKRAKLKLEPDKVNVVASRADQTTLLRELTEAMIAADVNRIKQLLADDVLSVSDGGNGHRA
ncbi:MAG: sigma-70 family RNA polymerase sigma factor, partial [Bacteroidia bacterium]|nr:sigma-70 family RNA polymerase sigma factor [Bacteroidia bacterium]